MQEIPTNSAQHSLAWVEEKPLKDVSITQQKRDVMEEA